MCETRIKNYSSLLKSGRLESCISAISYASVLVKNQLIRGALAFTNSTSFPLLPQRSNSIRRSQ